MCRKSPFVIKNYAGNAYHFLAQLQEYQLKNCKHMVSALDDDMVRLLYEAVMTQNLDAFKLVKAKCHDKIESDGMRSLVEGVERAYLWGREPGCTGVYQGPDDLD